MIPFIDMAAMHNEVRHDLDAVWRTAIDNSRFIGGPLVDQFEAEWADYCEARYCIGLSSGTAALHLAFTALGIGVGDEVIVPTNTFVASAAAVVAAGATPVFVDVDPATLLLTADAVRSAISQRTAAVLAVHLYGQPTDMDAINAIAAKAGIAVIEDAAQAHGATWNGRKVGSLSTAGCFSFYPGKNLGAAGDAGAVVTNDGVLAEKIRSLSNHGRSHDNPYRHDSIGGNHRLDALQAGILSVKLRRLDAWNEGRRRAASLYAKQLADLPVQWLATDPRSVSSVHLAVIQTEARDKLRDDMVEARIGVGVHYPIPCHEQIAFRTAKPARLPVAEHAAKRLLSLPMFPHLSEVQVTRVVEVIRHTLEARNQPGSSECMVN